MTFITDGQEVQIEVGEDEYLLGAAVAAGFVLLGSAFACTDLRILTKQKAELRQEREALGLPTPRG